MTFSYLSWVMKKIILPTLAIGVLLFFWQFISHAAGNFHKNSQQYTSKQATIASALDTMQLKEGRYMIQQPDPSTPMDKLETAWKQYEGQPWYFVTVYSPRNPDMLPYLIRGLGADLLAAFLIVMLFHWIGPMGLQKSIGIALFIGLIGYIYLPYTNNVWYPAFDMVATLIDCIVPFVIIGWMNAKWMNKQV
jgi:hypothetical protein